MKEGDEWRKEMSGGGKGRGNQSMEQETDKSGRVYEGMGGRGRYYGLW